MNTITEKHLKLAKEALFEVGRARIVHAPETIQGDVIKCIAQRIADSFPEPDAQWAENAAAEIIEKIPEWMNFPEDSEHECNKIIRSHAPACWWMPIETAKVPSPRSILVHCGDRMNTHTVYNDGQWKHTGGGFHPLQETPTHWMPLPQPPEAKG